MWRQMIPALRMTLWLTLLTGLLYPALVTALSQGLFPVQANGSLLTQDGRVIGSTLLGQNFTRPGYFHPRPSAAGSDGYDASSSGGSNFGPTSQKLLDRIQAAKSAEGLQTNIPADMLTASGSGLDPHISPANAQLQVPRVARARNIPEPELAELVNRHTEARTLGFLGEPRVNVLLLNLAVDHRWPARP
ncbi:MAG: K(+)-transporting ATPase subunit C [Acidobacteria bacterium]|nr:K(+)-transporting ATPase subunit C [Acidobacteriota bacterium]